MRRYATSLTAAAALITLAAATDAWGRGDRAVPEATPSGKPQSCLPLSSIRETRVRSDRMIDFITSNRRVYRNTLPNACPGLGFEQRFAYETSLSQLCSVDMITVLQSPGIQRGGRCGLGQFQPVTLATPPRR